MNWINRLRQIFQSQPATVAATSDPRTAAANAILAQFASDLSDARATGPITAPDPPPQPDDVTAAPDKQTLTSEYIAAAGGALGGGGVELYYRSLPPYIDDLTRDFGWDLYMRMLRDEAVGSGVDTLINGVMSDGVTLRPKVDDKKDQYYADSKKELERCEVEIDDLPRSADEILRDLLLSAAVGNRLAEIVMRKEGRAMPLDRLKIKPQQSYAFIVDAYGNLVGILPRMPGESNPMAVSSANKDTLRDEDILPREKFAVLSWMPPDEDPRGSSRLTRVYKAWWEKIEIGINYIKYLAQFASPSVIGILGKEAYDSFATDGLGNPTGAPVVTAIQKLLNILLRFMNGTAMALPPGTEVKTLFAATDGTAFLKALDRCDQRITKGITGQTLATDEAGKSSLGSAGPKVHQDTLGANYQYPKLMAARVFTRDVLRLMTKMNRGEAAVKNICPYATLSGTEQQDKVALINAYANGYKAGFIKDSQLPAISEELGLPPLTPEDMKAMADARAKAVSVGGPVPKGAGDQPGAADAPTAAGTEAAAGFAADDEGRWVTMEGQHVHIDKDGVIDKGPAHLVGRRHDELGKEKTADSSKKSPPTPNKTGEATAYRATKAEYAAARKQAKAKIAAAPVPTPEAVAKAREELERAKRGEGRAGGDSRGGSAASRRQQRQNLFREFGGEKRGYCVCHGCGLKIHADEDNEGGFARLERGKIFTKKQGGGYQLPNLLPECFGCNRSRSDTPIRKENLE